MNDSAPAPRSVDNRVIAYENDLAVLSIVAGYGHLRRSEIARAVWPSSSASVAQKMAYRTVKRLISGGHLRERNNSLGGRSLVLTDRGMAALRVHGIAARAGHELSSVAGPHFYHRTFGTMYLIERSAQGHTAYGEYALSTGRCLLSQSDLRESFGKIPDGLVLVPGNERGYTSEVNAADWIEVESSFKPEKELTKIFDVAWKVGCWLNETSSVILDRVVFVYDRTQHHELSILASLRKYLKQHPATANVLSSIAFARCSLALPLIWRGHEEVTHHALDREAVTQSSHHAAVLPSGTAV